MSLRLVALGFHRARCLGLRLIITGLVAALVVLVGAVGAASWVIRMVESRCLSSITLVNIAVIASLGHWQ